MTDGKEVIQQVRAIEGLDVRYADDDVVLICGDNREVVPRLAEAGVLVHSVVSDPPYNLTQVSRGGSARQEGTGPFGRVKLGTKGFMGHQWDAAEHVFHPEFWYDVLRCCLPGAFLFSFGGTRTSHRLACAIEDAGWEIRDEIENIVSGDQKWNRFWASLNSEQQGAYLEAVAPTSRLSMTFGVGFPKGLAIDKAIDKAQGLERERIRGVRSGVVQGTFANDDWSLEYKDSVLSREPISEAAKQWSGWNVSLKPSQEVIVVGVKPLPVERDFGMVLAKTSVFLFSEEVLCQRLNVPVSVAEMLLKSILPLYAREVESIVPKIARMQNLASREHARLVELCSTLNCQGFQGDTQSIAAANAETSFADDAVLVTAIGVAEHSCEEMAGSWSSAATNTGSTIALSWRNILADLWNRAKMFTTETKTLVTTELKILNSLVMRSIFQDGTQNNETQAGGVGLNVNIVDALLRSALAKSLLHDKTSALENAAWTFRNNRPSYDPIIVAMSPMPGSFAENAIRFGVAGLWVDGARLGLGGEKAQPGAGGLLSHVRDGKPYPGNGRVGEDSADRRYHDQGSTNMAALPGPRGGDPTGRWPPNTSMEHHQGCVCVGEAAAQRNVRIGESLYGPSVNCYGDGLAQKSTTGVLQAVDVWSCAAACECGHVFPDRSETVPGCCPRCQSHKTDWICPVKMLDLQAGHRVAGGFPERRFADKLRNSFGTFTTDSCPNGGLGRNSGVASRFFYTSKASSSERDCGLRGKIPCHNCGGLESVHHLMRREDRKVVGAQDCGRDGVPTVQEVAADLKRLRGKAELRDYPWLLVRCHRNYHPTLKSISVMRWIVRLSKTPTGGVVLDPFAGSATTGVACMLEGRPCILIEQDSGYCEIGAARLRACRDGAFDGSQRKSQKKSSPAPMVVASRANEKSSRGHRTLFPME